jgi:AraC-like DNA-binding protein
VNLELEIAPETQPTFNITTLPLLGVTVVNNSAPQMIVRNLVARAPDDDLLVGLPAMGQVSVKNGGDQLALGNTRMMLVAADVQHEVEYLTPADGFALRVKRSLMEPLVPNVSDLVNKPFDRNSAAVRLLLSYVRAIDAEEEITSPEMAHAVSAHICDLLALALGPSRDAAAVANSRGVRAARLAAIKTDVRENLVEPSLSAAVVAERHGVTPRYVHMLFELEGVTFSEHVVGQRLSRAHRMLTDPRFVHQSINSIALGVGFGDLSYFNRRFRRRFGLTPSDVRDRALRHGDN